MPQKWYVAHSNLSMLFLLDTAHSDSQQCCMSPETPLRQVKDTIPHTPALALCLLFALQLWLNKQTPVIHFYACYRLYSQILLKNILHCAIKSSLFTRHIPSINTLLYHVHLHICKFAQFGVWIPQSLLQMTQVFCIALKSVFHVRGKRDVHSYFSSQTL